MSFGQIISFSCSRRVHQAATCHGSLIRALDEHSAIGEGTPVHAAVFTLGSRANVCVQTPEHQEEKDCRQQLMLDASFMRPPECVCRGRR